MFNAQTRKLSSVLFTSVVALVATVSPVLAFTAGYTVVNNLNIPGITASRCMHTDGSNNVASTSTDCSTGTVTSVSGTANQITVTSPTTTPVISITNNPILPGTTTVGNLINSGLTASQCVGSDASKQLNSSGELCPTTYIAGVRAGGLHVETKQVTASATTPWQATVTFGAAYTAAPLCTATSFSAVPNVFPVDIVSESTTTAVIFDGSQSGAVFNVICIGF